MDVFNMLGKISLIANGCSQKCRCLTACSFLCCREGVSPSLYRELQLLLNDPFLNLQRFENHNHLLALAIDNADDQVTTQKHLS